MTQTIGTYCAKKIGKTLAITIPKSLGYEADQALILTINDDGSLTYTPVKEKNPWLNGAYDDYDFRADLKILDDEG